jgi:glycosyl hydrolase family 2
MRRTHQFAKSTNVPAFPSCGRRRHPFMLGDDMTGSSVENRCQAATVLFHFSAVQVAKGADMRQRLGQTPYSLLTSFQRVMRRQRVDRNSRQKCTVGTQVNGCSPMHSRRKFLNKTGALAVGTLSATLLSAADQKAQLAAVGTVSLCGEWWFRIDAENAGTGQRWYQASYTSAGWDTVNVPHTWQVAAALADYRGIAWYRRTFDVHADWQQSSVRIEFEAVFHTSTVWVNGQLAGEHARKGYTAFTLDITRFLYWGRPNNIAVRVDNTFDEHMVPRGHSSDWAHDGGIFRPVQLLITPKTFVERVDVEAAPDLPSTAGLLTVTACSRNTSLGSWIGRASFRVVDEESGLTVLNHQEPAHLSIKAGTTQTVSFRATLPEAKLWHFDHPNLYRLEVSIGDERESHQFTTTFGVRKLEVRNGGFYFNGEHVRLMGVERMAGSNPEFGMAEPTEWITHDHDDMKYLNSVFTRVHWPQDRRVLDYCDRHGILMQSEVPAWGSDTFGGMGAEPYSDIMDNALEQLREMIARDRNHPSVVVWGLCNEIWGQNPPAYQFASRMLHEAKKLDPSRLCAYASNSLSETPERDVSGLMDFIEVNEYFGTWAPGSAKTLGPHLDNLHAAFPGKPIVISEYGYCACTEDRPEGDEHRAEVLRSHDQVIRSKDYIGAAIFFCYNDYRTHVGDRGAGALKQRVHGVVDVFGTQKPSYRLLRDESSPVESLKVENKLNTFQVTVQARRDVPMYALRGYKLRGLFYGQGNIPVAQHEMDLPELPPGTEAKLELTFTQSEVPVHVEFDVLRPTHFSAYSLDWRP